MDNIVKYLCISVLLMPIFAKAQVSPKYEFRGAWVATVNNIDWPSRPGLSPEVQQREAIEMLDMLKALGMNAIIFQGRPTADAFYPSAFEPWSRYIMGTQGQDPGYDPLAFWINECHKRNMEFHLWCNPYRVAQSDKEQLSTNHIAFRHPEWIVGYGGKLYFNPGLPEVKVFIVDVIRDVVSRYDVDAIHFDDYFYPYPVSGQPFPDSETFNQYPNSYMPNQLADWRRNNVDEVIYRLSQAIKQTKPWVKFGISPFGVWRNQYVDPRGSATRAGVTNYDDLYADILKWLYNGWIDYITPQLYWQIGHPTVDFKHLSQWWNSNRFGKALYIGHALHNIDANSQTSEWRNPAHMPQQIKLTRQIQGIDGSVFYSAKHFKRNLLGLQDVLDRDLYASPALVPPMPWISKVSPKMPVNVVANNQSISWQASHATNEMDYAQRYILYYGKKKKFNLEDGRSILMVTNSTSVKISDNKGRKRKYFVRVASLNRLNNESNSTLPVKMKW